MKIESKNEKHIIVVDDDDDIRDLLVMLLHQSGYHVTGMHDLNTNEIEEVPDLFILDMLLSGKNGKQICNSIRQDERLKDVPVVMMSALTDVKQECLAAGADDFILKPFQVAELRGVVNRLLKRSAVEEN